MPTIQVVIVPFESAYPGFGDVKLLAGRDHVDVCKPDSREDEIYVQLLRFIRQSLGAAAAAADGATGGAGGAGGAAAAEP
jgi:hypothetical protein